MSGNRQLIYREHEDSDEETDVHAKRGKHPTEESSDLNEELVEEEACVATKRAPVSGLLHMIDTYDREPGAKAEGSFANLENYAVGLENKPGKRIPKAGILAEAGYGRARAEYRFFEAEARGPNASIGAELRLTKLRAMARAELASASAKAGPVTVKAGLGLDTGASISLHGVEAKFLGTGFSFGSKIGISLFGSEISFSFL
ncbi:uncharacterized protein LOC130411288 [Triplophysa dalaica]|uniref:uncharacterized protein LOC130411288 n=1 Tax=Triplophysa dalaica TaxID=1582913 RepID=UPI0024DFF184|nr:uncharacterized protein LOC130411288 [Triplophysa dalaica]